MRHSTTVAALVAAALLASVALTGCAGAKEAVKQTVEQGIEPTATGPHNSAIGNAAQGAVDSMNAAQQQQSELPPDGTGQ